VAIANIRCQPSATRDENPMSRRIGRTQRRRQRPASRGRREQDSVAAHFEGCGDGD